MILEEIVIALASIDGIATRDALLLGQLINQYGAATAGELMEQVLRNLATKAAPTKLPWE